MKKVMILFVAMIFTTVAVAQVQFTRNGKISFFSATPVEDIKAENNEVVSFLDTKKGEMRFQVLIKGFIFPKPAMQGHFNSSEYMDSDKFPQSNFKGEIQNLKDVNFTKDGTYQVKVKGDLTLHGITKPVQTNGTIIITGGVASSKAVFKINREEFGITVPAFTSGKIAKELEITVDCKYTPYNK